VSHRGVTSEHVQSLVHELSRDAPEGEPLSPVDRARIAYGVCTSVCVLDVASARTHATHAMEQGATPQELQEIATLVAGLGVHTFVAASQDLVEAAAAQGQPLPEVDLDGDEPWQRHVGDSGYWRAFEDRVPGFLGALRRLSPHAFEAFFHIGALTFRAELLPRRTIELASMAVDVTPGHRFLPGLALHVDGALRAGTGRRQVQDAVDLGMAAPPSPGVPQASRPVG